MSKKAFNSSYSYPEWWLDADSRQRYDNNDLINSFDDVQICFSRMWSTGELLVLKNFNAILSLWSKDNRGSSHMWTLQPSHDKSYLEWKECVCSTPSRVADQLQAKRRGNVFSRVSSLQCNWVCDARVSFIVKTEMVLPFIYQQNTAKQVLYHRIPSEFRKKERDNERDMTCNRVMCVLHKTIIFDEGIGMCCCAGKCLWQECER